jgi:hypothetical protein
VQETLRVGDTQKRTLNIQQKCERPDLKKVNKIFCLKIISDLFSFSLEGVFQNFLRKIAQKL